MKASLGRFAIDASGSTVIEYGLIGGLVFLALVVGVQAFSTEFHNVFKRVETAVKDATP